MLSLIFFFVTEKRSFVWKILFQKYQIIKLIKLLDSHENGAVTKTT